MARLFYLLVAAHGLHLVRYRMAFLSLEISPPPPPHCLRYPDQPLTRNTLLVTHTSDETTAHREIFAKIVERSHHRLGLAPR